MNSRILINKKSSKINLSLLFQNALALISSSIIIKVISLFNRIYMTRELGSYGISLYIISVPTIMLFTSIGGFSLNISIARFTASLKHKPSDIIKKGLKIALITSLLSVLILLLSSRLIASYALKQPLIYKILNISIFFIILTSLNNVFKGFLTGINKLKILSISAVIEQISRFLLVILIFNLRNKNIITLLINCINAMAFGEGISLIFNIIIYIKYNNNDKTTNYNKITKKDTKEIINFSFNTTLSHLITNIELFIEPILFTFALSLSNISKDTILYKYSEINAYVIPTLTLISFISFQISSALFPVFSKKYQEKNNDSISQISNKIIYYLFIIGIFFSNYFYFFGKEILYILYKVTTGTTSIKILSYFFIFTYITPIFNMLLQISNNDRYLLNTHLFLSILKLILIFILSIIPITINNSLIIAIIIMNLSLFVILFNKVNKIFKIKIPIIKLVFIFLYVFLSFFILNYFNINIIIITFIEILTILIILWCLK